jgi:hypothetical protein
MTAALSTAVDKRRRRTRDELEQLEHQILAELNYDHPQSIRHLFYRMTDPRLPEPVEKSDRGYRHVQHRVTDLRRRGLVPYGWISDATRRGFHTNTFASSAEFVRRMAGLYRADLWRDAGVYVEVWVESRSIAGIIVDECQDLAVSLYPAGGFTSITLAYQAADYINATTDNGAIPVHILYIGDYDPAGVLIDQSIERELREHLHPDVALTFHRIAITPDQIEDLDLPSKPRKAGDRRALHVRATVEAEAMPAHLMRALLRQEIEQFLPAQALHVARAAEESERAYLDLLADRMEAASR